MPPPIAPVACLLRDLLIRPSRAMDRLDEPGASLGASALIFAATLAANVALQSLKPEGFPPPDPGGAPFDVSGGWLFWTKVQAYNLPLTGIWIALGAYFARLLGSGRLAPRVLASAASLAPPLALVLLDWQGTLPRALLGAAWAALLLALAWCARGFPRERWLPLASLFLLLDGVSLAVAPLLGAAAWLRLSEPYQAVEMLSLFWTLGLATYGMSRVMRIKTARAFLAVFLSALGQILSLYALYRLALVPKDILRGLMSV